MIYKRTLKQISTSSNNPSVLLLIIWKMCLNKHVKVQGNNFNTTHSFSLNVSSTQLINNFIFLSFNS
jgi:hypothetical protein